MIKLMLAWVERHCITTLQARFSSTVTKDPIVKLCLLHALYIKTFYSSIDMYLHDVCVGVQNCHLDIVILFKII